MASRDSIVRDLLEKLRNAPNEELSEVADFAEFLHAKRLKRTASSTSLDELETRAIDFVDFLRERQARTGSTREERLRIAAAAGLIALPKPGHQRSSVDELPPVVVPGKPVSEMVIEDRR